VKNGEIFSEPSEFTKYNRNHYTIKISVTTNAKVEIVSASA
jgi:hypothetical protein